MTEIDNKDTSVRRWYSIQPEDLKKVQRIVTVEEIQAVEEPLKDALKKMITTRYGLDSNALENQLLPQLLCLGLLAQASWGDNDNIFGAAADLVQFNAILISGHDPVVDKLSDLIVEARDNMLKPSIKW